MRALGRITEIFCKLGNALGQHYRNFFARINNENFLRGVTERNTG